MHEPFVLTTEEVVVTGMAGWYGQPNAVSTGTPSALEMLAAADSVFRALGQSASSSEDTP